MKLLDSEARGCLRQFETRRTGTVANSFHGACRRGFDTTEGIVTAVSLEYKQKLASRYADDDDRAFYRQVIESLRDEGRTAALRYAASVITYERLPRSEQQRLKLQRRLPYLQAGRAGKPVTDARRHLLQDLGCVDEPADRREASERIDDLLSRQKGGLR
jgi:hypothetical protein